MCVCMHVCISVCVHVSMYVCAYVHLNKYIYGAMRAVMMITKKKQACVQLQPILYMCVKHTLRSNGV